jgi:hypothetical protein
VSETVFEHDQGLVQLTLRRAVHGDRSLIARAVHVQTLGARDGLRVSWILRDRETWKTVEVPPDNSMFIIVLSPRGLLLHDSRDHLRVDMRAFRSISQRHHPAYRGRGRRRHPPGQPGLVF